MATVYWVEEPPASGIYVWMGSDAPSSPSPALVERLKAYVSSGAAHVSNSDTAFIESCLTEAIELVDHACGATVVSVPVAVLERAYIEVGSELHHRRSAPQGVTQFASPNGDTPIRVSRDPLSGALLILRPYLPLGFA